MSLWLCPAHGLYGGDVFCPQCGGTGEYVTLTPLERAKASHRPMRSVDEIAGIAERAPAQAGRNAKRQDPQGLGPKDEHAVGGEADDAPNPSPDIHPPKAPGS